MSFFGQAHLLYQWTCTTASCPTSFRVTYWMFTILQLIYFVLFTFPFHHGISFRDSLSCDKVKFLCNFLFLMCLLLRMLGPITGPFIFRVLEFPYPVVAPDLVLYTGFILHCKDFMLLPSCCIKSSFSCLVRWVLYILTIVLLKLICVMKVVQYLFSFQT